MTVLSENLVMQKCRPLGAPPRFADARPEDYFYTVVACWLEPTASGGNRLMCAVVSDGSGGANVLEFLALEFSDLE